MSIFTDLTWRGLVNQTTAPEFLPEWLGTGQRTVYCGFDPTSDSLHVVERYTRTGPDHLMYEATIEDPKVFTRPWTIRMPLYRRVEANAQLLEFKCVEFAEELMYGHLTKKRTGN